MKIMDTIQHFRSSLKALLENSLPPLLDAVRETERQIMALENSPQGGLNESFGRLNTSLASIFNILQDSEMPPTLQAIQASAEAFSAYEKVLKRWAGFKKNQVKLLNEQLKTAGAPLLR